MVNYCSDSREKKILQSDTKKTSDQGYKALVVELQKIYNRRGSTGQNTIGASTSLLIQLVK